MRIFDGDISLRAQAEVDMAVFEGWLVDLCKVRDNLIEEAQLDDVALKENPPKSWEVSWSLCSSPVNTGEGGEGGRERDCGMGPANMM
jgi:hypothetical protein